MSMEREQGTYIQCTNCGKIHFIHIDVPVDKLYVKSECPKCGNWKGLNCGNSEDDVGLFYDAFLDERYYKY